MTDRAERLTMSVSEAAAELGIRAGAGMTPVNTSGSRRHRTSHSFPPGGTAMYSDGRSRRHPHALHSLPAQAKSHTSRRAGQLRPISNGEKAL